MKSMLKKIKGSGSTPSNMASNSSNQGGDTSNTQNGPQFVKKPIWRRGLDKMVDPTFKEMEIIVDDLFSEEATGEIQLQPSLLQLYVNETLCKMLKNKTIQDSCDENFQFLRECDQLMDDNKDAIDDHIRHIYEMYVMNGAEKEINLSFRVRRDTSKTYRNLGGLTLQEKREMFDNCIGEVEGVMEQTRERLMHDDAFKEHLQKWRGNLRKSNEFKHRIVDYKHAHQSRRGTVLVNSKHCKGMKLDLDTVPVNGYESPSPSPRAHSPFASLVSSLHGVDQTSIAQGVFKKKLQERMDEEKKTNDAQTATAAPSNMVSRPLPESGKSTKARAQNKKRIVVSSKANVKKSKVVSRAPPKSGTTSQSLLVSSNMPRNSKHKLKPSKSSRSVSVDRTMLQFALSLLELDDDQKSKTISIKL